MFQVEAAGTPDATTEKKYNPEKPNGRPGLCVKTSFQLQLSLTK